MLSFVTYQILLVYAEASDSCNTLDFQLGPTGIGATIPTRQWNIRVGDLNSFLPK
jgi:hypothetical protein